MKIELLEQREDFLPVFKRSLSAFLRSAFQSEADFVEGPGASLVFRMNPALNLIFPEGIRPVELDVLTAEFRYAPQFLRRLLQTAYCRFAVRWPLRAFMCPVVFGLNNPPKGLRSWVFLPGNHTVRAIDVAKNASIVFAKAGFDGAFFLRDAEVRQAHPSLPVPAVLEFHPEDGWYKEARIAGLPLNRLVAEKDRQDAFNTALEALTTLRDATGTKMSAHAYSGQIAKEISDQTVVLESAMGPVVVQAQRLADLARAQVLAVPDFELSLCQTHGDFQPANILYDGGKTWLIDWEYSAVRSRFFDSLVFETQSRFAAGFGERLSALIRRAGAMEVGTPFSTQPPDRIAALIAVFLLEELQLKLSEVAADAIIDKSSGLKAWLDACLPVLEAPSEINPRQANA